MQPYLYLVSDRDFWETSSRGCNEYRRTHTHTHTQVHGRPRDPELRATRCSLDSRCLLCCTCLLSFSLSLALSLCLSLFLSRGVRDLQIVNPRRRSRLELNEVQRCGCWTAARACGSVVGAAVCGNRWCRSSRNERIRGSVTHGYVAERKSGEAKLAKCVIN